MLPHPPWAEWQGGAHTKTHGADARWQLPPRGRCLAPPKHLVLGGVGGLREALATLHGAALLTQVLLR